MPLNRRHQEPFKPSDSGCEFFMDDSRGERVVCFVPSATLLELAKREGVAAAGVDAATVNKQLFEQGRVRLRIEEIAGRKYDTGPPELGHYDIVVGTDDLDLWAT